jgi:hypothetical protein
VTSRETIYRTVSYDEAFSFLFTYVPEAEPLTTMAAVLGEGCEVQVDPVSRRGYIFGPAWWESAVQPGEGECDTWTVEEMSASELLYTELLPEFLEQARRTPRNPVVLRGLVHEIAFVHELLATVPAPTPRKHSPLRHPGRTVSRTLRCLY